MDFGKQIRQIRKDAKLTQEQMAAKLNVSLWLMYHSDLS